MDQIKKLYSHINIVHIHYQFGPFHSFLFHAASTVKKTLVSIDISMILKSTLMKVFGRFPYIGGINRKKRITSQHHEDKNNESRQNLLALFLSMSTVTAAYTLSYCVHSYASMPF